MKCWPTTLAILTVLLASLGLAEDFKTINGKIYKDTTISRVEADGIVLKTKTGISKVYFVELPKSVRERFFPTPAKTVVPQREPIKATNRKAASGNPTAFTIFLVTGSIVIAAVVVVIVRHRLQMTNNDASKV